MKLDSKLMLNFPNKQLMYIRLPSATIWRAGRRQPSQNPSTSTHRFQLVRIEGKQIGDDSRLRRYLLNGDINYLFTICCEMGTNEIKITSILGQLGKKYEQKPQNEETKMIYC